MKNSLPGFMAPDHDLATTQASFLFPFSVQEDRWSGHQVTACLAKRDVAWWDVARHSGYYRSPQKITSCSQVVHQIQGGNWVCTVKVHQPNPPWHFSFVCFCFCYDSINVDWKCFVWWQSHHVSEILCVFLPTIETDVAVMQFKFLENQNNLETSEFM